MTYTSRMTTNEFHEFIHAKRKVKAYWYPTNNIIYGKHQGNKIQLVGQFFQSAGSWEVRNGRLYFHLETTIRNGYLLIIPLAIVTFLTLMPIVSDNVIIQGDSDPSFWKRMIAYVLTAIIFVVMPFAVLIHSLRSYTRNLEEELHLDRT